MSSTDQTEKITDEVEPKGSGLPVRALVIGTFAVFAALVVLPSAIASVLHMVKGGRGEIQMDERPDWVTGGGSSSSGQSGSSYSEENPERQVASIEELNQQLEVLAAENGIAAPSVTGQSQMELTVPELKAPELPELAVPQLPKLEMPELPTLEAPTLDGGSGTTSSADLLARAQQLLESDG